MPGDLCGSDPRDSHSTVQQAGPGNLSPPEGASAFKPKVQVARAAELKAGWNLGTVRKELTDSRCAGVWSAAASTEHRLHHLP